MKKIYVDSEKSIYLKRKKGYVIWLLIGEFFYQFVNYIFENTVFEKNSRLQPLILV